MQCGRATINPNIDDPCTSSDVTITNKTTFHATDEQHAVAIAAGLELEKAMDGGDEAGTATPTELHSNASNALSETHGDIVGKFCFDECFGITRERAVEGIEWFCPVLNWTLGGLEVSLACPGTSKLRSYGKE